MKLSKRKTLILALCIIAISSILIAQPLLHSGPNLDNAVTKAINFLKDSQEPYALPMLDVIHRRFGTNEFADALQRYDQMLAEHPPQETILRIFRRIADHNNPLQEKDLQVVVADQDRITTFALYCDRFGLPDDYPAMLEQAANSGGYFLTHVLLAWIWIQENGCEYTLPDGFIENVYSGCAALIGNDPVVDDVELEAAAFLYFAGKDELVDDAFAERVIAAQNQDGGWSLSSGDSDGSHWHATLLSLMFLLHVKCPADSYPPMLAPALP